MGFDGRALRATTICARRSHSVRPGKKTHTPLFAGIIRAMNGQTESWKGVFFGVGIAAFAAYQQFKLPVVLPILLERYGYERTLAGGFVSVYALAGLLLSVELGRRIERNGTAGAILIALGVIIAGSALALLKPEMGIVVLAGRALEGAGFAALAICGPVLATANAPPRQLPIVIGLTAAWIPIGQLSAVAIAPLALAVGDWQLMWWVGIAAALFIAALTVSFRHDPNVRLAPSGQSTRQRADAAQGTSDAQPHPGDAPAPQMTMSAHERHTLIIVAGIFGLWSGQYFAYMTWLPQYLVEVHGLAVRGALANYLLPVIAVIAFNIIAGAMLRAGVQLGPLMSAAIMTQAAVWWLLPVTGDGWGGALSLAVYGISAGFVPTCLFASPGAVLGAGRSTAAAFGVVMSGRNLGVLIGPVLLAWVAGNGNAWHQGTLLFALMTSCALALALWLTWRLRQH